MDKDPRDIAQTGGVGLGGLLLVLFVGLKLTGYISWSWWWVLAPLWVPLAILVVIAIILFLSLATTKDNPFR